MRLIYDDVPCYTCIDCPEIATSRVTAFHFHPSGSELNEAQAHRLPLPQRFSNRIDLPLSQVLFAGLFERCPMSQLLLIGQLLGQVTTLVALCARLHSLVSVCIRKLRKRARDNGILSQGELGSPPLPARLSSGLPRGCFRACLRCCCCCRLPASGADRLP